jgi:Multiubiquitin
MSASTMEGAAQVPGGPRSVRVTVNGQPVDLPDREMTGREIKEAAIEQGVKIQPSFQLSVKHGNRYEVVGDTDLVKVHANEEFLAVAPDDNS